MYFSTAARVQSRVKISNSHCFVTKTTYWHKGNVPLSPPGTTFFAEIGSSLQHRNSPGDWVSSNPLNKDSGNLVV